MSAAPAVDVNLPAYELAPGALPAASIDRLLSARRMTTVRGILDEQRRQCQAYLLNWRPGHPDLRDVILDTLTQLDQALVEVEHAERGCGSEDGECVCLCHAGVRHPDAPATLAG